MRTPGRSARNAGRPHSLRVSIAFRLPFSRGILSKPASGSRRSEKQQRLTGADFSLSCGAAPCTLCCSVQFTIPGTNGITTSAHFGSQLQGIKKHLAMLSSAPNTRNRSRQVVLRSTHNADGPPRSQWCSVQFMIQEKKNLSCPGHTMKARER